jgi:type VI secretion system protein ImpA
MAKLARAAAETPGPFFVELYEDMTQCREAFAQLTSALDDRAGSAAPPSSNIRAAIDSCLDVVKSLARDKLAVATTGETAADEGGDTPAAGGAPAGPPGAIRTRDDALQSLLKVADFFRRTEPHNPVSYALEQAVRWSRMPLPELLTELIPDESSRFALFKQVGIKPPEPS